MEYEEQHAMEEPLTGEPKIRTVQSFVADGLRRAILTGELRADQALRQGKIADQFGVSKIPVREALKLLEGEGLVTFSPHRGAVVSSLSAPDVEEVGRIRIALESLALRLAIQVATPKDVAQAEALLEQASEEGASNAKYAELNYRFHVSLYPIAQARLLGMIKPLYAAFDRYSQLYEALTKVHAQAQKEHRTILQLYKRRDADRSVVALSQHIENTVDILLDYLRQDRPAGCG